MSLPRNERADLRLSKTSAAQCKAAIGDGLPADSPRGNSEHVMKTRILICAAAAMALSLEGVRAFSRQSSAVARLPRAELTLVQDSNGRFHGIGVVTDIDAETGALTVNHQEIKGLMPAM